MLRFTSAFRTHLIPDDCSLVVLEQEIAWFLKGSVSRCDHREYGFAQLQMLKLGEDTTSADALFEGLGERMQVRPLPECMSVLIN